MGTNELQKYAVEELSNAGFVVWRTNSGRAMHNLRLAPAGTPDIIGYRGPWGHFVAFEVKYGKDKLRESQKAWINKARAEGVFVAVIRKKTDVAKAVEMYRIEREHDRT